MKRLGMAFCVLAGLFTAPLAHAFGLEFFSRMNPSRYFEGPQLDAYRMAHKGQAVELAKKVNSGEVDLNKPGKQDLTLLGYAVVAADTVALQTLIKAGANPDQIIKDAGSPAVMAISRYANPPSTKVLNALLMAGYDPNKLLDGKPYLFYFVDHNHWNGLRLALKYGKNLNVTNSSGKSLLVYTMDGLDFDMAKELIAAGADVNQASKTGETALAAAEFTLLISEPGTQEWKLRLAVRQMILDRLPASANRQTPFTEKLHNMLDKITK